MKALIIEDEEAAYKSLAKMIKEIDCDINIVGWVRSVKKAINWFELNEMPDLIFLDIQLTDGISFEIFDKLEISAPVIFTTAYSKFAIKAFETNGVDYLLKPFNKERLSQSIKKYIKYHTKPNPVAINTIIDLLQTNKEEDVYKSRFLVKIGDKLKTVLTSEIAFFYRDDLVTIVTKENKRYLIDYSLDELVEMLNPEYFFRINRQFIVHINSIAQVHKYFKGKLKLKLSLNIDNELIISQEKASKFKKWLNGDI